MRPAPFVPAVGAISPQEAGKIPGLGAVISHWTEGARSPAGWLREAGTAGFVVRRGDEVLGFAVCAPAEHLPRAAAYPVGPLDENAVLLAYVGGDARTRRRLLVRVLRELRHRGAGGVEAVASDRGVRHHVPTRFLLQSGWKPVRRAWYGGSPYTLVRTDLGSTVEVGELARGLVGRVRLPRLKAPTPAPGTFAGASMSGLHKGRSLVQAGLQASGFGHQDCCSRASVL